MGATRQRLASLAQTDPNLAPLIRLELVLLQAASDSTWAEAAQGLDPATARQRWADGMPALRRATLAVDPERVRTLLGKLVDTLRPTGNPAVEPLRAALGQRRLDLLACLEATIRQQPGRLAELAEAAAVEPALLATLMPLAARPLLQACARALADELAEANWAAGCCPVCAGWPGLAELRGLERLRRLRCLACAGDWGFPQLGCPYCGEDDYRQFGRLMPEEHGEARFVAVCERCHGYVKTMTTFGAIPAVGLAAEDLVTVALDVAAVERDYQRPDQPAFPLEFHLEPAARRGGLWSGLRR